MGLGSRVYGVRGFVREAPRFGPLFDDLTRAKSAKELKEPLETRVL